ncbi:hypothetical protein SUGI_0453350 [Cryptomeria japonica]|nr:hypothetical protein SUGI_0453350 [Cryptomeria japonica]
MKRSSSICYISGLMSFGILAMVFVLAAVSLFLEKNNQYHQYQYKQQYPPANNATSSTPTNKSVSSSFNLQGFEVMYANMVLNSYNFTKMRSDWDMLYANLHRKLYSKGLRGPSEMHCFLWLADCYNLAQHPIFAKSLIPILGPDIILHGIKLWRLANGTARNLHLDNESGDCDEVVNVIIGSKVRILKGSQMYEGRWRHTLLKNIAALNAHQNHANIEDIIIGTVRKGIIRRQGNPMDDISFITIEPGEGNIVILHGNVVYGIEAASIGEETAILQFASAKCKIRDNKQALNNVFLPPVLLISERNLSLFSWKSLSIKCKTKHGCRTFRYGSASTAVLSKVSFEYSDFKAEGAHFKEFTSDDEEKIVIVLSGSLLYFCADMEVQGYREMGILEIHGSMYIPVGGWHALVPASPYRNAFVSVRWKRRTMVTGQRWLGSRGFFGFRTIILQSGQAYDPSNENNCDVILVMLYGKSLQMLPSEISLEESHTLLISGGDPCLLWNIGKASVAFVAIHVCGYDEQIEHLFNGDPRASSYFSGGGVFSFVSKNQASSANAC